MTLSADQIRFLLLHAQHTVIKWQWHFCDTILRAYTDAGRTATAARRDVEDMLHRGLLIEAGGHSVAITKQGREQVAMEGAT